RRVVTAELGEADHVQVALHRGVDASAWQTLCLQAPGDVAGDRLPGKEREFLEHHAAVGPGAVHLPAVNTDRSGVGPDEAAHAVEQLALAAAAGSEDGDDLTGTHREALHIQHRELAAVLVVDLPDPRGLEG